MQFFLYNSTKSFMSIFTSNVFIMFLCTRQSARLLNRCWLKVARRQWFKWQCGAGWAQMTTRQRRRKRDAEGVEGGIRNGEGVSPSPAD